MSTATLSVAKAVSYELRWCPNGVQDCDLKEGLYVQGGYFVDLRHCTDAIKHLKYYGNKVGAACVEMPGWEKENLKEK